MGYVVDVDSTLRHLPRLAVGSIADVSEVSLMLPPRSTLKNAASACWSLDLLIDTEDVGSIFLRNDC
jgi:hypothetical protein